MSIATYRSVVCDVCGTYTGPLRSSSEARALARRRGWTRRRVASVYVDLCAGCSAGFG